MEKKITCRGCEKKFSVKVGTKNSQGMVICPHCGTKNHFLKKENGKIVNKRILPY